MYIILIDTNYTFEKKLLLQVLNCSCNLENIIGVQQNLRGKPGTEHKLKGRYKIQGGGRVTKLREITTKISRFTKKKHCPLIVRIPIRIAVGSLSI